MGNPIDDHVLASLHVGVVVDLQEIAKELGMRGDTINGVILKLIWDYQDKKGSAKKSVQLLPEYSWCRVIAVPHYRCIICHETFTAEEKDRHENQPHVVAYKEKVKQIRDSRKKRKGESRRE